MRIYLPVVILLIASPAPAMTQNTAAAVRADSLVQPWAAASAAARASGSFEASTSAIVDVLLYPSDPTGVMAVPDALELVALRSGDEWTRGLAVQMMTIGYWEQGSNSGPLVERFQRMYEGTQDSVVRRGILGALGMIQGNGRQQAITWLGPLMALETESLAFPSEAYAAVQAAAAMGPAGLQLVRRLRDQGSITDRRALDRARMIPDV